MVVHAVKNASQNPCVQINRFPVKLGEVENLLAVKSLLELC